MNRFSKLLLMGMALAFMVPAVAAPTLTFKFTAVNIPGAAQVQAYGISESGGDRWGIYRYGQYSPRFRAQRQNRDHLNASGKA